MSTSVSTQTLCLGDLLGDRISFRVPSFQRPYSWTTREASQLLDDVLLSLADEPGGGAPDGGHFFGAILLVVAPPAGEGAPEWADIVDGQQRLVTLTILLAMLRDLAADRGLALEDAIKPMLSMTDANGSPSSRLELGGQEHGFFRQFVLERGASAAMPEVDVDGVEQRILDVREHFASELVLRSSDELAGIVHYLRSACSVAVITTRNIDRAHRIFTVLNNRGRPLARNDILKAHVLGLIPSASQDAYTHRWQALERRLGDRFEELFSHIRTIAGRSRERIIAGVGDLIDEHGGAERFFDDVLEPYGALQSAIIRGEGPTPLASRYITYLGWIGSSDWMPAAMLWWRTCNGAPDQLETFLRRFERLAFCLRLLGIGADKRLSRFNSVLAAIRSGRLDAPDNPLDLTREELRNIAHNLRGLHTRSQLTCKLLLLRLNDELAGAPQCLDPQLYTVEHILPQRPNRNSAWRKAFPKSEEREASTHSLGNLVIITRRQNDRARNLELDRKLAVYFAPEYQPVPHITRDIETIGAWGPADVRAREDRLLAAVDRLWSIDTSKAGGEGLSGDAAAPLGQT